MKQVYNIGKWSYLITLGFYGIALIGLLFSFITSSGNPSGAHIIGVFLGLLAQIALGIIHLILVIYVYSDLSKLKTEDKPFLYGYTLMLPVFFTSWWLLATTDYFEDFFYLVVFVIVVPMLIGGYFLYVLHRIRTSERIAESKTEILNG